MVAPACVQREAENRKHDRSMWGQMVDRSLRMWRFTLRLPHYLVKFLGFKLQQVVFCPSCSLEHHLLLSVYDVFTKPAHCAPPLHAALAGLMTEISVISNIEVQAQGLLRAPSTVVSALLTRLYSVCLPAFEPVCGGMCSPRSGSLSTMSTPATLHHCTSRCR